MNMASAPGVAPGFPRPAGRLPIPGAVYQPGHTDMARLVPSFHQRTAMMRPPGPVPGARWPVQQLQPFGGPRPPYTAPLPRAANMHTPRPPRPPDKPLLPYQRFSRKIWDTIKAEQPNLKPWDVSRTIGQLWKEMIDVDKQAYQESYEKEKVEYDEALRVYFSSQTYYAWQQNRMKVQQPGPSGSLALKPGMGVTALFPSEDDHNPDDKSASVKHVAAARFRRNHLLLNDIFSDSHVPEMKATAVTEERLTELHNQVKSLEAQHKELEAEISEMQSRFETKKRKLHDSFSQYEVVMMKLCKSPLLEDDLTA